jgi:transketolase C-terminal domain/subunit
MSKITISGRELIKQILDSVRDLNAPVYIKLDGEKTLRAVWFAGHEHKLGEGAVITIREVKP